MSSNTGLMRVVGKNFYVLAQGIMHYLAVERAVLGVTQFVPKPVMSRGSFDQVRRGQQHLHGFLGYQ
ncbi:MAG: hypothetical protein ABSG53_12930, partial [Thermoguttaceae bacterium]